MFKDLVRNNRSFRRFYQEIAIELATLKDLVDMARVAASGRNIQPLKYILSCDPAQNSKIFETLAWAGYLKNWRPEEGERPSAYIIVLGDTSLTNTFGIDPGIAAQTILLGAVDLGLGGCMIASINKPLLMQTLKIPDRYEILLVLALGKPKENVVLEQLPESGDVTYWRDDQQNHHVPKRSLDEIIIHLDS